MLSCQFVPLERWPKKPTENPIRARFKATWDKITRSLDSELQKLRAEKIVIEAGFQRSEIRNDGWPKSAARPTKHGVIVSFVGKHGPASFPCDSFVWWQDNVYAIARSLEALRMVDRYGVTFGGEQYRGFAALPPPADSVTSKQEAAAILATWSSVDVNLITQDLEWASRAWREAVQRTHPDKPGGNADAFKAVELARKVLLQK